MLQNIAKLTTIVVVTVFSSTLFAGTNIWTETGPNASNAYIAFSANPSIAFARGGDKLWKSTDGGITWVTKRSLNTENYPFALDPSNANILLMQGTSFEGLLRSLDGGETFTGVSSIETNGIKFSPDGTVVYAVMTNLPYVRRSVDKGATWSTTSNTGFPSIMTSGPIPTPIEIAIHPSDPDIVYVGFRNDNAQGVYKSTDGGSNWTAATGLQGIYVNAMALQPGDPAHIYIATDSGLYRSLDSGTSWNKIDDPTLSGVATAAISAIAFDTVNSTIIYAGGKNRGEIFYSSDGGSTWIRRDQGVIASTITSLAPRPGVSGELLAGTTHTVYRTTNSGQNWAVSANGIRAASVATVSIGTKLRVGLYDGGIYESVDGSNWTPLNNEALRSVLPNQQFSQILEIHDASQLFVLTNNGALARSPDDGNTWLLRPASFNPLQNGSNGGFLTESGLGPIHYAATYSGVLKSIDDGETWFTASSGMPTPAFVTSLAKSKDSSNLYAGTITSGVYKSVDHAGTWFAVNNGLTSANNLNIRCLAYDETNDVLIIGTNDGIFASTDGGNTNVPLTNPIPGSQASIDSIWVEDFLYGAIYVGIQGRVYRSVDRGVSWTELTAGAFASTFTYISRIVGDGPGVIYAGEAYTGLNVFTVSPDLQLSASAPTAGNFAIGTQIPWSVTVTNNGPFSSTFSKFSWQLPPNVSIINPTSSRGSCATATGGLFTCDFGILQVGATTTVNMTIRGDSGGTVHLNASVSSAEIDLDSSNNSFSDAGMRFVEQADLTTTLTTSASNVYSGSTFDYVLNVTNNGSTLVTGASVTTNFDTRDRYTLTQGTLTGCTGNVAGTLQCPLPTLSPGATATFRWTATAVPSGIRSASAIASVDPDKSNELNPSDNSASTSLMVTAANDLSIALSSSTAQVAQGATIDYTLSATNGGVIDADPITVQFLPGSGLSFVSSTGTTCINSDSSVSCNIGSLSAGAVTNIGIVMSAMIPGTVISTANINGPNFDPISSNNSATASVNITPVTDLSLEITTSTTSVTQGESFTYTLAVTNKSAINNASAVHAHLTLGSNVSFSNATGATCSVTDSVVTCDFGMIASGSSESVTIDVLAMSAGNALSAGDVESSDPDPDTTNNSANAPTVAITSPEPANAPPSSSGGSGGGGGSISLFFMMALLMLNFVSKYVRVSQTTKIVRKPNI